MRDWLHLVISTYDVVVRTYVHCMYVCGGNFYNIHMYYICRWCVCVCVCVCVFVCVECPCTEILFIMYVSLHQCRL